MDKEESARQKEEIKKHWKVMTAAQKVRYFVDYYLLKTLVIVVAVGTVIFLIWNYFKPVETPVLYAAVFDDPMQDDKLQSLQSQMLAMLAPDDPHATVILNTNFSSATDGSYRLLIYMSTRQVDAVIAEKDVIQQIAGEGNLVPVDEVLSSEDAAKYSADYVEAPGYLENESDLNDNGASQGEVRVYGVDISDSQVWKDAGCTLKDPVFAFSENSDHADNAVRFLKVLKP